jgi:sec-independent protein translocase protein TatB
MFDIGFAELLLIAVVGLLVIGPERLPGAIRTTSAWVSRIRRGFDEVKAEVQRELHNDEVMRQLRESADAVKQEIDQAGESVSAERDELARTIQPPTSDSSQDKPS